MIQRSHHAKQRNLQARSIIILAFQAATLIFQILETRAGNTGSRLHCSSQSSVKRQQWHKDYSLQNHQLEQQKLQCVGIRGGEGTIQEEKVEALFYDSKNEDSLTTIADESESTTSVLEKLLETVLHSSSDSSMNSEESYTITTKIQLGDKKDHESLDEKDDINDSATKIVEEAAISEGGGNDEGEDKREKKEIEEEGKEQEIEIEEEEEEEETEVSEIEKDELLEQALQLRQQGKDLHDQSYFIEAAEIFSEASNLLATNGQQCKQNIDQETVEALATCLLHESLCRLKGDQWDLCEEACNKVLELEDKLAAGGDTAAVAVSIPAVLRARAYHRRAKARLSMDNFDGALQDAKSAAFLGDRKAVAFYGKLMRESSSPMDGNDDMSSLADAFNSLSSNMAAATSSNPLLESLLNSGSGDNILASSFLQRLAGPSPSSDSDSVPTKKNRRGRRGDKNGSSGGGGSNSLAQSVLLSLSKRLEDENTQESICQFLQSTNPIQLKSMADMAGVSITSGQAEKIVSFCHGVSPKTLKSTIRTVKRAIFCVQMVRRTIRILSKYRYALMILVLLQWTKSAIYRPLPVRKATKKALQEAAKAALQQ